MKRLPLVALLLVVAAAFAKEQKVPALADVHSLYITGTDAGAVAARQALQKGKSCFALAPSQDAADATLEVSASSASLGGGIGMMGGQTWAVSGTITVKGAAVWSRTERFSDTGLSSGASRAASLLVAHACQAKP